MKRLVTSGPKGWNPDAVAPHLGDAYHRNDVQVGQTDKDAWRSWLLVAVCMIVTYFGVRCL